MSKEQSLIFSGPDVESKQEALLPLVELTPEEAERLDDDLHAMKVSFKWGPIYRIDGLNPEVSEILIIQPYREAVPEVLVKEHSVSMDGQDQYAILQITDNYSYTKVNPLEMKITPTGVIQIRSGNSPVPVICAASDMSHRKYSYRGQFVQRETPRIMVSPPPSFFRLELPDIPQHERQKANILEIIEAPWRRDVYKDKHELIKALNKIPELYFIKRNKKIPLKNLPVQIFSRRDGKKLYVIGDEVFVEAVASTESRLVIGIKNYLDVIKLENPFESCVVSTGKAILGGDKILNELKVAQFASNSGELVLFCNVQAFLQGKRIWGVKVTSD